MSAPVYWGLWIAFVLYAVGLYKCTVIWARQDQTDVDRVVSVIALLVGFYAAWAIWQVLP